MVKNKFTFANNNLVKSEPDLSFSHSSKPVTRASLVQFVSSFQRTYTAQTLIDSLEKPNDKVFCALKVLK